MWSKLSREEIIFENEHHGRCTLCDTPLEDGETTAFGYNKQQEMQYVCHNCLSKIDIKVRYLHRNRPYKTPQSNDMLWRFIDLAKFISLLKESALYLTRVDQFLDPFECAIGVIDDKPRYDAFYLNFCKHAVATAPIEDKTKLTPEYVQKNAERLFKDIAEWNQRNRVKSFVSCWHKNTAESEAMWQLYVKDLTQGIAIQTTYTKLYNALNREPEISIGEVNYIDYTQQTVYMNDVQWYKRKSFEHEREVRVLKYVHDASDTCLGIKQPIDVNMLIENIFVSPFAKQWFIDVVNDVLQKYNIVKTVLPSKLNVKPFYG